MHENANTRIIHYRSRCYHLRMHSPGDRNKKQVNLKLLVLVLEDQLLFFTNFPFMINATIDVPTKVADQ